MRKEKEIKEELKRARECRKLALREKRWIATTLWEGVIDTLKWVLE